MGRRSRCVAAALIVLVGASCSSDDDAGDAGTIDATPTSVAAGGGISPSTSADAGEPVDSALEEADLSTTSATGTEQPGDVVEAKDVRTRVDGLIGEGVTPAGFTTVEARITSADGEVCTVCLWLADTSDERSRGLMGVTDLGDAVGMAFLFDSPTDSRFFMFQTPAPLSIAWFDASGGFVASTDMEPCLAVDVGTCARYSPGAAYTMAVEMFQGELDVVGIEPGSTIELVAGSESLACA